MIQDAGRPSLLSAALEKQQSQRDLLAGTGALYPQHDFSVPLLGWDEEGDEHLYCGVWRSRSRRRVPVVWFRRPAPSAGTALWIRPGRAVGMKRKRENKYIKTRALYPTLLPPSRQNTGIVPHSYLLWEDWPPGGSEGSMLSTVDYCRWENKGSAAR